MPLYFIDGGVCRLATKEDVGAAHKSMSEPHPKGLVSQPRFDGTRLKWIRVTGPANAYAVTVGKVYRVIRWETGAPHFSGNGRLDVWGRWPGNAPTLTNPGWEPALAPRKRKAKGVRRG